MKELLEIKLSRESLFQFLTDPTHRLRVARHGVLWTVFLFLIYKRFDFNAVLLTSPAERQMYVNLSTLVFGSLTILDYILITLLLRQFVIRRSQVSLFVLGLFGVHLLTALLVYWHVGWFVDLFTLKHLPIAYRTFAHDVIGLRFWQIPFNPVLIGVFCFSLVYSYLLVVLTPKIFKDLFTISIKRGQLEKDNLQLEKDNLQLEKDNLQLEKDNLQLEKDNLQLEYLFLKAQINPHFLFNTLNNIFSLATYSPEKTPNAIQKLSALMRYTLYGTETDYVPLIQEISFLEDYLQLQRLRYSAGADLTLVVEGVPDQKLAIAPLLLIVFVENAFKHGAAKSMKPPHVKIRIAIGEAGILSFEVVNDVDECLSTEGAEGGIGLRNARRRLEQYYRDHYSLDIGYQGIEHQVSLKLDLTWKPLTALSLSTMSPLPVTSSLAM